MKAVILAAGMGKRLGKFTKGGTKCMVKVNGKPLIKYAIDSLLMAGISDITLVVGYKAEGLKALIKEHYPELPVGYIENPIYGKTNNIYSLWLAREVLESDDIILLESDIIFRPELISELVASPEPNLAAVSKFESWMDGTVTILNENDAIISVIGKSDFRWSDTEHYYKTVNIYKFSRGFSTKRYLPFMEAYLSAFGTNEYYEQILRILVFLENTGLKGFRVSSRCWYEIDDPHDLHIAETIFSDPENRLRLMQERYGGYWRFSGLLDFCYLVNPYFPTEQMWKEMGANFKEVSSQYPSGMKIQSIVAGKIFMVSPEQIVVGNGAADLIASLLRASKGAVGIVEPTFNEYPERAGIDRVIRYSAKMNDFSYQPKDVISTWKLGQASWGILINPDNPSGHFLVCDTVEKFVEECEAAGIRPIVDESFVDFAEPGLRFSLLNEEYLNKHHSLVVIRSISKSYGVPGLRLGVLASGDEELIRVIKKDVAIWNVNSPAELFMQIFDKHKTDYRIACDKIVAERTRLSLELQAINGITVYPSQANYILVKIDNKVDSRTLSERILFEHNILIKDLGGKPGFPTGTFIRVAVKNRGENDRLISAIETTLSSTRR
jgi:histidinol-phosphate/aromatic aminotransferase/cobyric acid decarboxylase-like protein/choline kinase